MSAVTYSIISKLIHGNFAVFFGLGTINDLIKARCDIFVVSYGISVSFAQQYAQMLKCLRVVLICLNACLLT